MGIADGVGRSDAPTGDVEAGGLRYRAAICRYQVTPDTQRECIRAKKGNREALQLLPLRAHKADGHISPHPKGCLIVFSGLGCGF